MSIKKHKSIKRKKNSRPMSSQSPAESNALRIIAAVKGIPRGRVSTYGNVASLAGLPRRARLVGTVLRQSPGSRGLPWYRVINASGRISFPVGSDAYARQRLKLEAEGIVVSGGRISLAKYGWPPRAATLDEYLWKLGDE
jgi:methylated-DNA-protein-cysteine methyltransferase-like protein